MKEAIHRAERLFATLLLLNLAWSPVNALVDVATSSHGFSPAGLARVRWVSMCACFWLLISIPKVRRAFGIKFPRPAHILYAVAIGFSFTGPAHLLYYVSLGHITSIEGTVLNVTAPLITAGLAVLVLRERITAKRGIALGLGFIGAYITSVGFALPVLTGGTTTWSLIYLLGTVLECSGGVLVAWLILKSSGIAVFAAETIGITLAMFVYPALLPSHLPMVIPHLDIHWLPVAYLALVAGVFCFGCWSVLVEKAPLSLMVVSLAVQPPFAAVIGIVFLHERMPIDLIIGSLIITAALLFGALDRPATAATKNVPANKEDGQSRAENDHETGRVDGAALNIVRQELAESEQGNY